VQEHRAGGCLNLKKAGWRRKNVEILYLKRGVVVDVVATLQKD
jgi:hypothetical protein